MKKRQIRRRRIEMEACEPRLLLSDVTLITHGYEANGVMPDWVATMATAVAAREGGASIYKMTLGVSQSTVVVNSFTQLSGGDPRTTANGDIVIELDWAAESGLILFLYSKYSTTQVASAVVPYLLTNALPNLGGALAQLPFHLIGHSRGGSLVSEMARLLGQSGVWVDQMTTLDPHPVSPDPAAAPTSNIRFADNYYETSALPNGTTVAGAYNLNLTSVDPNHSGIHAYYHGTIDLNAASDGAADGAAAISSSWYASPARGATGFYYTLTGGGARPTIGTGTAFGGTGTRVADAAVGAQWANIGAITPGAATVNTGAPLTIGYQFEDRDSAATVHWFLDTDQNPYDNTETMIGTSTRAGTGDAVGNYLATYTPAANQAGTYYLGALVEDGTHARLAYAPGVLVIHAAPGIMGDATLDGKVDVDDYLAIDTGFVRHLSGWANGDFSGNGTVDALDYALLDPAYMAQHPLAGETSLNAARGASVGGLAAQYGEAMVMSPPLGPMPVIREARGAVLRGVFAPVNAPMNVNRMSRVPAVLVSAGGVDVDDADDAGKYLPAKADHFLVNVLRPAELPVFGLRLDLLRGR